MGVEDLYIKSHEEDDAELEAYNSCLRFLTEKSDNLKIKSIPFRYFYSIYKNRYSFFLCGLYGPAGH